MSCASAVGAASHSNAAIAGAAVADRPAGDLASDPASGRFSRCTEFGRFDVMRDDLRFDHTIVQPRDGVERGENRAFLPHRDIGCVLAGEHDSPIDLAQVVVVLRPNFLRPFEVRS